MEWKGDRKHFPLVYLAWQRCVRLEDVDEYIAELERTLEEWPPRDKHLIVEWHHD